MAKDLSGDGMPGSNDAQGVPYDQLVDELESAKARIALLESRLARASQAEEQLRLITDGLPIFLAAFDSDLRYVYVNQIYARMRYGRSQTWFIGRHFKDVVGEENWTQLADGVDRCLAGESVALEVQVPFVDGSWHDVGAALVPNLDVDGNVVGMYAFGYDITEIRRAESAVREREQHLRRMMDALPFQLAELSKESTVSFVNRACARWHGIDRDSPRVCRIDDLARSHDDRRFAGLVARALAGETVEFEGTAVSRAGQRRTFRNVLVPEGAPAGDTNSVIAVGIDITALKEAEERLRLNARQLRQIIDLVPFMIYAKDKDGRFLFANQATEAVYGMPVDDLVGRLQKDTHLGEAWLPRLHRGDEAVYSGRTDTYRASIDEFPFADGESRSIDFIKVPLIVAGDQMPAVLVIGIDVTERRLLEQAMLHQDRLATLGRLTASVSHEIRNPLGAIRASTYVLRSAMQDAPASADRALTRVERNITRCDLIIDQLLDFSRLGSLQVELVAVADWLGELLDDQAIPEGVELVTQFDDDLAEIRMDPERMRRAMVNVLTNACQAMAPKGSIAPTGAASELTLVARRAGQRLELVVSDTGEGIDPKDLPRVFEPFFSTKGFGTGLGMPLVKQILEQHSGGVEIQARPEGGTRVALWVPYADGSG